MILIRTVLVFFIVWFWTETLANDTSLQVVAESPRSARITGPKRLTDLGKGTYSKWVGCSYGIEWGDGSFSPSGPAGSDCALGLSHNYRTAGIYRIRAKIFHPAPDDHLIDDWSDLVTFKTK